MTYISSFTYCDNIQTEMTSQGPINQIVNPLQILTPVAIPGNYSFAISFNVVGLDTSKENSLQIVFESPSNKVVYDSNPINIQKPDTQIHPENIGIMQFNLDIRNLVLMEEGMYTTKVQVNNDLVNEYPIQVIKGDIYELDKSMA